MTIQTTVGEFCPFEYGKGLSENKRLSGNIPVYGSNGIVGMHNEPFVKTHGIIIGRKGTVGALHLSARPFWPIDTSFYVVKENYYETVYTFYLLKSLELDGMNSDSAVPGLNRNNAHALKINVVETSEQRSNIGRLISKFDDKIENNQRMNETLYEMARTIFKSWFIDFDPVHAKVNGKKLKYIDAEIVKIFPDSFSENSLPFGWKEISFGKLVKPKRGKVITKKNSKNGAFPVVAGGVKPAYYHNTYNTKSPVVTISASGNAGFVNIYYSNIWASDCSFINKDITKYVYFSHCFLKINQKKLFDMQHGAVQKHINPNDIMRLTTKIGSNQILDMFEQTVSHLYEKIALNLKENQTLTELRDTLLPKLMAGEIRLKDAEREVEAAV